MSDIKKFIKGRKQIVTGTLCLYAGIRGLGRWLSDTDQLLPILIKKYSSCHSRQRTPFWKWIHFYYKCPSRCPCRFGSQSSFTQKLLGWGHFFLKQSSQRVNLSTHFHLRPRLWMSGTTAKFLSPVRLHGVHKDYTRSFIRTTNLVCLLKARRHVGPFQIKAVRRILSPKSEDITGW
jgi:hypothetical protein